MSQGYDNAASYYDRLARLVYGDTLLQAQRWLVQHIPASSRILVAGGGTGWILEAIAAVHGSGLSIDYAELSPKMIARARRRAYGSNIVTFIQAPVQHMDSATGRYDVVITPFLLDSFTEQEMQAACTAISNKLSTHGLWLHCDFMDTGKLQHKLLLQTMFTFFRLVGSVQTTRLPAINEWFVQHGYSRVAGNTYIQGFVAADIYRRI